MAVKHMPMSSLIVGIDLDPIRTVKGCTTIVGDITTQKSRQVHVGVILFPPSPPPLFLGRESCSLHQHAVKKPTSVIVLADSLRPTWQNLESGTGKMITASQFLRHLMTNILMHCMQDICTKCTGAALTGLPN